MTALHEDNVSSPLKASRRWSVSASGEDHSPCWPTLDTTGREWLSRGELVQWRKTIIDGKESTTVRAKTHAILTRFLTEVEARSLPSRWIPVPLVDLEIVDVTDPADPLYRNGLPIRALMKSLERSWYPGWHVRWFPTVARAKLHGDANACRTQMRITATDASDEITRLVAVATPTLVDVQTLI